VTSISTDLPHGAIPKGRHTFPSVCDEGNEYKNVNNKCYAKAWITPAITTSCINKRRLCIFSRNIDELNTKDFSKIIERYLLHYYS
jgi:hypothetical protein